MGTSQSSKNKRRSQRIQALPAKHGTVGAWFKRLARRSAMGLLRFLWGQIKWWLWIGGFFGASLVAMRMHYFWPSSILLWGAILIAVGWVVSLLGSIFGGSDDYTPYYDDNPSKPRESWREREQRETQEMFDDHQREREDHGQV